MKRDHQSKKEINLLLFAFIVIAILAIASKTVGFYQIEAMHKITSDMYEHPLKVSNAALDVKLETHKMHKNIRTILLSPSENVVSQQIKNLKMHEKNIDQKLNIIEKYILGEKGKLIIKETKKLFDASKLIRKNVIDLVQKNRATEAI
ncbi:MAG: hypothetical protein GQ474_07775, partial [Sulfurimonas sp.]|nr:hypothetical protein [Sulfurimonas sp.]